MSSPAKMSKALFSRASSGIKSLTSGLNAASKGPLSVASSGIQSLETTLDSGLNSMMNNSYFYVALRVFLVLYAAFAAPALPKTVALLMDSTIVRILFAVVIVYVAIDDPLSGILLAVAFIITLQTANKFKLYNSSESVLSPHGISWLPSAKQGAVGTDPNQSVENVVNSGVKQVVGGVNLLGGAATDSVEHTGGGVLSGARTIGSSMVGSVRHLGSGLLGGTQQIGKGLYVGVEQVGSGLLGGVSTLGGCILDSATQVGSGVASGVQSVGSGLVGGARQVGSGVLSGTQELATGLVGGTAQVGSGVWQGVRSLGKPVGLSEHFYDATAPEGADANAGFAPFTSDALFENASSNVVPGADQGSCVQALTNQYCVQGFQSEGVQGFQCEGVQRSSNISN
jgi:hypothetical protein